MKHISLELLSGIVVRRRRSLKLSQTELSRKAGINRSLISRLEAKDYCPSVDQLLSLSQVLRFSIGDVIVDEEAKTAAVGRQKIAVIACGHVGLSLAVLLSQHNDVTVVDLLPEKVAKIRAWESPIKDEYIEKYMAEHEERKLSLSASVDAESVYRDALLLLPSLLTIIPGPIFLTAPRWKAFCLRSNPLLQNGRLSPSWSSNRQFLSATLLMSGRGWGWTISSSARNFCVSPWPSMTTSIQAGS